MDSKNKNRSLLILGKNLISSLELRSKKIDISTSKPVISNTIRSFLEGNNTSRKLKYLWGKLRNNRSLQLLTLSSAILICTGGEAIAQVCPPGQNEVSASGNADSQNVTNGTVINPNNVLGVPDTNVANLDGTLFNPDRIVLNLTDLVPEGSNITITLTRVTDNGSSNSHFDRVVRSRTE